jgi:hypothetical protein
MCQSNDFGLCRKIAADFVPLPRPPPLQNLDPNPETLDPKPEVHEEQKGEGRTSTGLGLVNVIFTELIYCAGSTVTRTFSVPITVKLKPVLTSKVTLVNPVLKGKKSGQVAR